MPKDAKSLTFAWHLGQPAEVCAGIPGARGVKVMVTIGDFVEDLS